MAKNRFIITDENMPVSDTTVGASIIEQPEITLRYDYTQVPDVDRDQLMSAAIRIKRHESGASRHIWQIGRELVDAKQLVPHGQWMLWLSREFDYSDTMAQTFMNTYRRFPNFAEIEMLGRSVLGLLVSGTTPPEVVDAVVGEAKQGNLLGVKEVKERIAVARQSRNGAAGGGGTGSQARSEPHSEPRAEAAGSIAAGVPGPAGLSVGPLPGRFVPAREPVEAPAVTPAREESRPGDEAAVWLDVFRQAVDLLGDYMEATGDHANGDMARMALGMVIRKLERGGV